MLKIDNLNIKSGYRQLFTINNLELKEGSMTLIVGDNCCGKSLFLKNIFKNIKKYLILDKYKKNKVLSVLVDNEDNLINEHSVWNNLNSCNFKRQKHIKDFSVELCKIANLYGKLQEKVKNLSYAEKKIIEIIRAIIIEPKLILIDDIDMYFDDIYLLKAVTLLNSSLKMDKEKCILLTSKVPLSNFKDVYVIKEGKLKV